MSYRKQVRNRYLGTGFAWVFAGMFAILPYKITYVFEIICLLFAIYLMVTTLRKSKEEADEMAVANMNEAKADTLDIGNILLLIISMVAGDLLISTLGIDLNVSKFLSPLIMIFIGLEDVIVALRFIALEDE